MDVIDFDEIKAMIISVLFIFNMMPNVNVIAVIIKYPEDRTTLGSMPLQDSRSVHGFVSLHLCAHSLLGDRVQDGRHEETAPI